MSPDPNQSPNPNPGGNWPVAGNPGPEAMDTAAPVQVLEYAQLLWFRKWSVIAITLLFGVFGWVWSNQQTPIYEAESTIMVGMVNANMASREMMMVSMLNKRFKSADEVEVLKSRSLSEQVVKGLDLLSYPEFNPSLRVSEPGLLDGLNPAEWIPESWKETSEAAMDRSPDMESRAMEADIEKRRLDTATNILMGGLRFSSSELSNVINVSYRSSNPELAAKIANELPEVYMLSTLQSRYEATQKATKWLSEQMEELRLEVEAAEQAVELYRVEHGLTDVGSTDLVTAQLGKLNSELIIARAERAEAEARLAQVRRLLQQGQASAEAATRLMDSSMVQQLRQQETEAQRHISELAVEFGPKHPRMLQAQAELAQTRAAMETEIEKIEVSLQSDVEFARAREQGLRASQAEAETAAGQQSQQSIQLRALEREAAASRALFTTFLEQFKTTTSSEGMNDPGGRVLSKALVPSSPKYPNVPKSTMSTAFLGFALAVMLVLGIEFLNPGVANPEEVESKLGARTIGIIPNARSKTAAENLPLEDPQSGYVEALNTLKVSLSLTDPDHEPRVVQVTSSLPAEGKTTLALSLARLLASKDKKVILVDGDLRRATVEKMLGLPSNSEGLTDLVLQNEDNVEKYLMQDPDSDVRVLPPGSAQFVNASDVFSSQRMQHLVEIMRESADYVIIDAPPVMAVADARLIGRLVDKTLFVIRWNKTPAKVARAAMKILHDSGIGIAGVVMQRVDVKRYSQGYGGGSGYYYHYGRYGQYDKS